jgi:protoporphyrin/coproporphyrin ferrochelatase
METSPRRESCTPQPGPQAQPETAQTAVVLLNLGTPESPDPKTVRVYLAEFLGDPEVIRLPHGWKWATPLLAHLIAFFRAKKSAANYAQIWTDRGSPLLAISQDQTEALQAELGQAFQVELAMRYGRPSLDSVFDRLDSMDIKRVLLLPMYPHFSRPTTGTALAQVYALLARRGLCYQVDVVSSWHDYRPYWEAQAWQIQEYIDRNGLTPETSVLLFSAHGLPLSYIAAGDPYQKEITACIQEISQLLKWPAEKIITSYQSRLGPVEWVGPSTEKVLHGLASHQVKNVAVCPISFTADCVETFHEIGIEYRRLFEQESGGKLWLIPALNTSPVFIQALKSLVLRTLGGAPC